MKTTSLLITALSATLYTYVLAATGLLLITSAGAMAQSRTDADMLLARASHARLVDGDIEDAISIYRQLAMSSSASRFHVATALVGLGDSYQLTGSTESVPAYERVLSEFGDQPAPFQQASSKLRLLLASNTAAGVTVNATGQHVLLMSEVPRFSTSLPRIYDFSPDGARMVFHAPATAERKARFPNLVRELYIQDTRGSVRRPVMDNAADWEFINLPRWSPDGNRMLYTAFKGIGDDGSRQLYKHDFLTGESRQIVNLEQFNSEALRGLNWMPDGRSFVTLWYDGVRRFSLDGDLIRHYEQKVDHMTMIGNVSPDGRFLLYHRVDPDKEDHEEMDLWMLDLENGTSRQLSSESGYEGWPVWSKDGSHIYYVSGPRDAHNVFRRKFDSNETPEKITTYSNASAIYPTILGEEGQISFTLMKDNHTVLAGNSPSEARTIVRGNSPMLSPSGEHIYYLNSEPGKTGLWVTSMEGDSSRQLVEGEIITPYGPKKFLSPDGSSITYAKNEGDVTTLYVMAATGGDAKKLYSTPGVRHLIPSWSPDSKEIAFSIHGDMMVISANSGEPKVLANVKHWESWNIEWSPDGAQLAAFAYLEGEEANHIMLISRESGEMQRLTLATEAQYKEILAWHPDGKRISYMYYNTEDGNGSRIIDIESGQISDIADLPDPMWDYFGVWGPDGRYYFSSATRGMGNLWELHAYDDRTGEYETIRISERGSVSMPTWNGDGSIMAWSEREPVRQMWMMINYE